MQDRQQNETDNILLTQNRRRLTRHWTKTSPPKGQSTGCAVANNGWADTR